MSVGVEDKAEGLWRLVWGRPEVDPEALARAIEHALDADEHDVRTQLLIRDGADALERHWGADRWGAWLARGSNRGRLDVIRGEDLGPPKFNFDKARLMEATTPETIREYLRQLGRRVSRGVLLRIGGSASLILTGHLSRATEDIDVVDEVPEEIRSDRRLLPQLRSDYGLILAHFASHYLPKGWETRLHDQGSFGKVRVQTIDPYDLFVCKLFSKRAKDLRDLRALKPKMDKAKIVDRLSTTTDALRRDDVLLTSAEENWYILYDEPLPASKTPGDASPNT